MTIIRDTQMYRRVVRYAMLGDTSGGVTEVAQSVSGGEREACGGCNGSAVSSQRLKFSRYAPSALRVDCRNV